MIFDSDKIKSASIIASFKQMIYLNHKCLELIEPSTNLSTLDRQHLQTAKLCNFQLSRLCNLLDYFIETETMHSAPEYKNFDIANLVKEITRTFKNTVSRYMPVQINCYTKVSLSSILIDKALFELTILNVLYCCLKAYPQDRSQPIKLTLYATETKDNFVFHIRDNNPHIDISALKDLLDQPTPNLRFIDDWSYTMLTGLSLKMAQNSAARLKGKLTCSPLKSGNRYDIALPKFPDIMPHTLSSITLYSPTYKYYTELFADISLEHILNQVIESFGDFEGFLK